MNECFDCKYVCPTNECLVPDCLELELQTLVKHHVHAGNQNQIFGKSSQLSEPLRNHPAPILSEILMLIIMDYFSMTQ